MSIYDDGRIVTFEDNSQVVVSEFGLATESDNIVEHVVTENDTLFNISNKVLKYTSDWYKIAELNNIEDPIEPPIGLQLIIPLNG